uniref:Uncharacterized protein n=1 Tax=Octopus bimaculoides TaxID=37653 RepID=A0A0L8G158_OCTBM
MCCRRFSLDRILPACSPYYFVNLFPTVSLVFPSHVTICLHHSTRYFIIYILYFVKSIVRLFCFLFFFVYHLTD